MLLYMEQSFLYRRILVQDFSELHKFLGAAVFPDASDWSIAETDQSETIWKTVAPSASELKSPWLSGTACPMY